MLITKFQSISGKDITITNEYKTVCNGVKKTSSAKVNTPHKLEKQFDDLCRTHLDKKRNGFIARKKALKAK